MEAGHVGVVGGLVVNPVELVLRNVLEVVHNQRLNMAGNRAQGQPGKNECATSKPVLVRRKIIKRTSEFYSYLRLLSQI